MDEDSETFTLSFYLIPTTGVRVDPGDTHSIVIGMINDTSMLILLYKLAREANRRIDNAVLSSSL